MYSRPPIAGLTNEPVWRYNIGDCIEISPSKLKMLRYCRQYYRLNSKAKIKVGGVLLRVRVQTWFAKAKNYFVIDSTLDPCSTPSSTLEHYSSALSLALPSLSNDFESSQTSLRSF